MSRMLRVHHGYIYMRTFIHTLVVIKAVH